jgi:hypothetical protein
MPSTATTAVPVRVLPARGAGGFAVPRRCLAASAKFAAIALLTAAAALLVLDWALFDTPAIAPRLPLHDRGSPDGKLVLAARHRDAEVLYVGDSRILAGVDPSVASQACGCGPGYNAGFSAAEPRLTRIMVDRVLEKLSPGVVVIGVSQWELSDRARINLERPARQLVAPWDLDDFGVQLDPAERVEATVGAVWRLYRFRGSVRDALDPSTWTARRGHELRRGFDARDGGRKPGEDEFEERADQWFSDFAVRGRRAEALGALLGDLRGRGIRVLLVAPPLHPRLHARVRREVDAFRAAMERLATDSGVPFEDFTEPRRIGLDVDRFLDTVHVDDEGAATFSRRLGRAIRSRLGTGEARPPPVSG